MFACAENVDVNLCGCSFVDKEWKKNTKLKRKTQSALRRRPMKFIHKYLRISRDNNVYFIFPVHCPCILYSRPFFTCFFFFSSSFCFCSLALYFFHFCFRLKNLFWLFLCDEMRYFGLWFVCLVNTVREKKKTLAEKVARAHRTSWKIKWSCSLDHFHICPRAVWHQFTKF